MKPDWRRWTAGCRPRQLDAHIALDLGRERTRWRPPCRRWRAVLGGANRRGAGRERSRTGRGSGRRWPTIPRWARCGSTACPCICPPRTGASGRARPASASTTRRCSGDCWAWPPRSGQPPGGGRDMSRPRPGLTGSRDRAGERAGRLRRQAAGRHGRRRDPGRAARRRSGAATYPPSSTTKPGPERSLWWWHYNTSKPA